MGGKKKYIDMFGSVTEPFRYGRLILQYAVLNILSIPAYCLRCFGGTGIRGLMRSLVTWSLL